MRPLLMVLPLLLLLWTVSWAQTSSATLYRVVTLSPTLTARWLRAARDSLPLFAIAST
jgi:hypothetical protein